MKLSYTTTRRAVQQLANNLAAGAANTPDGPTTLRKLLERRGEAAVRALRAFRNVAEDPGDEDYQEKLAKELALLVPGDPQLAGMLERLGDPAQMAPAGDSGAPAATRPAYAGLAPLVGELHVLLQRVPDQQREEAEIAAEYARMLQEQLRKTHPNKMLLRIALDGLQQSAQRLQGTAPGIWALVGRIASLVSD